MDDIIARRNNFRRVRMTDLLDNRYLTTLKLCSYCRFHLRKSSTLFGSAEKRKLQREMTHDCFLKKETGYLAVFNPRINLKNRFKKKQTWKQHPYNNICAPIFSSSGWRSQMLFQTISAHMKYCWTTQSISLCQLTFWAYLQSCSVFSRQTAHCFKKLWAYPHTALLNLR